MEEEEASSVRKCLLPHLPKDNRSHLPSESSVLPCTCHGLVPSSEGLVCLQDGLPLLLPVTAGSSGEPGWPEESRRSKDLSGRKDVVSCCGNYCSVNYRLHPVNSSSFVGSQMVTDLRIMCMSTNMHGAFAWKATGADFQSPREPG